jgi:hypothetical protein
MKKAVFLVMAVFLSATLFGCGGGGSQDQAAPGGSTTASSETEGDTTATTPTESEAYEITYQNAYLTADSIGSVWVHAIAEVTNTGTLPLYLNSGKFDLETADGSLLDSMDMVSSYPLIIQPGEKGYYTADTTVDDVSADTAVQIVPHVDIEKATVEDLRLPTSEVSLAADDYGGIKAIGRVENTTSEEQPLVYIVVVLYDANDTPLAAMFTILMDNLAAGDKVSFEVNNSLGDSSITPDSVDHYTIIAYPHQFQF